jgi:hypothetical protein
MKKTIQALACIAAAAASAAGHAAGSAVDTMGDPVYFARYAHFDIVGNVTGTGEASSFGDASGSVGVNAVTGALWNQLPALQQAVVTNDGATYWARASGPTLPSTPAIGTPTGAYSGVDIYQSFTKTSEMATLSFTYTGALLESFRDPEFRPECAAINCTYAQLRWEVSVWLNSDPSAPPLMVESGQASLYAQNNVFNFDASQYASDGTPANALWAWDCARCGLPALGLAQATLQAPFTGIVDLGAIPFDPQFAQQPEFTVRFSLLATADVSRAWSGATAWGRDPLDLGNDAGIGLTVFDLQPTNNPIGVVPEPATWLSFIAGLAALGARRRQGHHGAVG